VKAKERQKAQRQKGLSCVAAGEEGRGEEIR